MRLVRTASLLAFSVMLVGAAGCSSKNSKKVAASGTAKTTTTKQPVTAPKPTTKTGGNVAYNQSSAISVQADSECSAAEEGLAACSDTFAVFCASSKLYALDCAAAFSASCGVLDDGTVDCVTESEE